MAVTIRRLKCLHPGRLHGGGATGGCEHVIALSLLGFWHAFRIWVVSDKEGRGKELIFLAVAFSRSSLFLLRGEAADDL